LSFVAYSTSRAMVGDRRAYRMAGVEKAYRRRVEDFPLPHQGIVAVPAPAAGPLNWAGAPSAALDDDGTIVLAYRQHEANPSRHANVVARSDDGERFEAVATLDRERFGAAGLERPAVMRLDDGRWRLYVCCATPASKHWWIGALEAERPEGFVDAEVRTVFPGDDRVGVKDPVISRRDGVWHAWICCHPLDVPEEEDRMTTAFARSDDGLRWTWHGAVLEPRPGAWDARGTRLTAVLPDGRAAYDGRATKEENWFERTGLAVPGSRPHELVGTSPPVSTARYLDVLPLPGGGCRLYYEFPLPDRSHELRTDLLL
jgi:hypothetical protein